MSFSLFRMGDHFWVHDRTPVRSLSSSRAPPVLSSSYWHFMFASVWESDYINSDTAGLSSLHERSRIDDSAGPSRCNSDCSCKKEGNGCSKWIPPFPRVGLRTRRLLLL